MVDTLGHGSADDTYAILLRMQSVAAGIRVDTEIADDHCRHRIEGKPGEQGFESGARDHAPTMRRPG
jgi:hypothetical protein